jgi:hypothetical protein
MADSKITGLTETTAPLLTDILPIVTDPGGTPATKKVTAADLLALAGSGWTAADAMTYAAADAPTFTMTCSGDQTGKYSPGMRVKLTQTTVKYFIITAVAYTSSTTITLYGGTDYTLTGGAISSPYYSSAKAPVGFPLNPAKWTVEVTDTSNQTQSSPTQNAYYNLGSLSISVPIGTWTLEYLVNQYAYKSPATDCIIKSTLSTANNSESDAIMSARLYTSSVTTVIASAYRKRFLTVAAKTAYYLNAMTSTASMTEIGHRGDYSTTVIRAICAYL